jgi:hypothetical protein
MRGPKSIVSSVILSVMVCGAAIAAPATVPAKTPSAPAAADADCQRVGGEVSALIDKGTASPNLPAARAAFQVGIMECMEGDDAAANKHYQDAKKLLSNEQPNAPVSPAKPKQAG